MSQKERFYLYSQALGLTKEDAERRALNRIIGVFDFAEVTDEQLAELNTKLLENLNYKNIPIPDTDEKPKQITVEDMTVDEIRNVLKPCEHEWTEYTKESEIFALARECNICGAVAVALGLKVGVPCKHESAILVAQSPTKFVSCCPDCQFWLIEPMRNRTSR
jgi:hypothetical protein